MGVLFKAYRSQQSSETLGVFGLDGVPLTEPTTLVLLDLGLVGIRIKYHNQLQKSEYSIL